jgi:hypothetical protein
LKSFTGKKGKSLEAKCGERETSLIAAASTDDGLSRNWVEKNQIQEEICDCKLESFFFFRESLTMTTCVSRFCTRQHSLFFIFIFPLFHLVTFYFSQRQGDLLFPSDSHVHLQVVLTYGKKKEKMITQSLEGGGYNNNGHIVPL